MNIVGADHLQEWASLAVPGLGEREVVHCWTQLVPDDAAGQIPWPTLQLQHQQIPRYQGLWLEGPYGSSQPPALCTSAGDARCVDDFNACSYLIALARSYCAPMVGLLKDSPKLHGVTLLHHYSVASSQWVPEEFSFVLKREGEGLESCQSQMEWSLSELTFVLMLVFLWLIRCAAISLSAFHHAV